MRQGKLGTTQNSNSGPARIRYECKIRRSMPWTQWAFRLQTIHANQATQMDSLYATGKNTSTLFYGSLSYADTPANLTPSSYSTHEARNPPRVRTVLQQEETPRTGLLHSYCSAKPLLIPLPQAAGAANTYSATNIPNARLRSRHCKSA